MDKSCHSSADSTSSSSSSSNRDHFLKHLNKISHRISKPVIRRPPLDQNHLLLHHRPPPAPPQPPPPPLQQPTPPPPPPHNHFHPPQPQPQNGLQPPPHQPPVYNINKNDFRDVVQKLTGSPAHERFSTPPPIHPPKPQSSRLQRIRPPPLAAVGNRPPPLLNAGPPQPPPSSAAASGLNPSNHPNVATAAASPAVGTFASNFRQPTPLSPLPPFPSVHGAAESPISAYLRCFQGSIAATNSDPKQQLSRYSSVISPRWSNPAPPPPSQQQHIPPPSSSTALPQFPAQSSPLPFGCLPSPRSQYPLLSPSLLFSPTAGQMGFPGSPTLPVPSPRWRDL